MSTYKERYEERKKQREGQENSSSYQARYLARKVESGELDINAIGNEISERVNTWVKNNQNYISNANNRFSNKNPSYRADTSDWLSTVTKQNENFKAEADALKNYLGMYKSLFSEDYVNSVIQTLDGNLKIQGDVISNSNKDLEYWSQWESEDAYNEWYKAYQAEQDMLKYDLGAGKAEISDLEKSYDEAAKISTELRNLEQTLRNGYTRAGYSKDGIEKAISEDSRIINLRKQLEAYGDVDALNSTLSEKRAYYTQAERAQRAVELASVADTDSANYDREFKKYATQGQSMDDGNTPIVIFGNTIADNPIEAWRRYYADSPAVDEDYGAGKIGNEASFALAMTEDEVNIYNYYLAKEGKDKAEEYLDLIADRVNSRVASGYFSQVKEKPILEYAFGVAAGLDQFTSGIKGIFADGYTPTSSMQYASSMVREDLADTGATLPDWLGGSSLGQVGYDVITTTSNMLPSILASTAVNMVAPGAGAVVGAGLMGVSAGGQAKAEMLNLGYSKAQANAYGAMVAIAEGGMEYFLGGISKLGGKLPEGITGAILSKVDNAFARTAIKIGGGMLSEGFEEGLQTVIEPWLKEIATGVDWEDPNIDEVLYSSLLGALSAFGLEGATTVAGEVGTYKSGKKIQKVDGGVERLKATGSLFSADSVAYKLASKVDENTNAYTIGRLLNEVGATLSEQNMTDIVNGLTEKGLRKSDATKLAKQYQAFLNGEMNLSDEVVRTLENLSPLADVLRTNIIGANTTVYQRTREYSDLMKLADEVSNSKKKSKNAESTKEVNEQTAPAMNVFDQQRLVADVQNVASDVSKEIARPGSTSIKRQMDEVRQKASEGVVNSLGIEGKYSSSETGATRLASNRKKVNIVGVDSIDKGSLKLKLDDGSVVNAEEIDFSSVDEALVYEAVTNMGVSANTAWEILKGYNPKSNQQGAMYAMGALEAYTYGHNGVKVEGMSKDGFSAFLSETQKNTANKLGDIDARAKVEAQQKSIDKAVKTVRDDAKSKHKAIPRRKGETIFEGDRTKLTDLQEKQLGVLEKISNGLDVTFHIFESKEDAKGKRYYKMPNGKITSANGWYDPKTGEIWIDLHAGNRGQGTMIFTAAHELTHFIRQWSPAKFKVFADFLMEQYGKKGQDVNQLIRVQMQKAANNGRSISWDEAYEEVIADSCETFLRDSKAAEKIASLHEKDASLANKIKTFIGQMLAKMRKLMADLGLAPETAEGKMVAEMTDSLQKLYDLWTDALADAGKAYSTLANIDFNTDSVAPMLSERTRTASEYVTEREETAKKISNALGVDINTAYKYIDDINSVARLIADDRARLDYEPNLDEKATVLKTNKEYKYSVDMSTLCAKRLLFTGTFDAIQRALPNTVFDSEDIVALREMMLKRGYEVSCGICYVESTRREIGRITQEFIDRYKVAQKTGKPISRINSSGKEVVLKSAGKTFNADKNYTPNLGDLNTTDIDLVKRDHPEVYDAYLAFMNARGQAKPKLLETRAEYKGEILKHFKARSAVEARNNAGGLRLQSFSDFEVPHLIDMMQIVMDMSRVGLKSQAYTKVPAFAEVFGDTGVKINLSLIAKGDGLDANGNLIFDDVEGINHKEAFKLRDKYSKNVGTILVGKTDAHIIAAMTDPRIDYIIPFHKSSWKESLYDALGLTGYADYTDYQNEKPIDKDRKIKNFDPSEYWDFSKTGDENAQIYLAKCREDGRIPKFPQFQGYPGYWKLLIDFKMYDNDGVGSPQEVVKPEFNTEASERILSEYKGGHKNFPVAQDVVEDFVKAHKDNVKLSDGDSNSKYSFRAYTDKQKENWKNAKRIVLYENELQFKDFINKARSDNNFTKKMYFGAIPSDLATLIQSETGLNVENFNCSLSAYEIRKIFKDHGDEAKEAPRGQRAITEDDIMDIPVVIQSPKDIKLSEKEYEGKPVIEFSKQTNGKLTVAAVVSDKHLDLFVQTAYVGIKKGNLSTPTGEQAPINTPEANNGTVSNNRIPHLVDSVNSNSEKTSLRSVEPIETSDYVKMYHHFGSTKNYDVAGYILGNGMMLDFSGKHWGDDFSTSRQVDHRDIQEVLGNRGSNNGVNAMVDMIGNGNIRLMPEVGGINLAVKPNATQMSQLRGYINHFRGEVEIDIDAVGGDTIHSFSYTRGTSSSKILADIKAYFDEGIVPEKKAENETDIHQFLFSEREEAPPTKTEKAYKLMRLVDGKLYPLFIGNNEEISVGTWYNADSPNLSQLKNLAPGTHLVDMKTGEAMTWDEYAERYVPKKNGKPTRSKPSKDDVHWANDNGYRFMHIEEKAGGKSEGTMLKKYGDTRAYYNWGVNGSSKTESGEGSASLYALRPGWHFGEVPSMHQIGYDGEEGETVRLDNQVWVEVEMSADVDYNAEAEANWSGDIPTHIPTNGYYRYATNPTQKKTKGGKTANDATKADWYVAGAFKVNRILSDSEADSIVENYNKTNGKNVPLDYRRNYGRVFNAETMSIEDSVRYSDRVLMGSLFSGGGTLEAGLVYQMLDKEFAVEYNKKIAATYTDNHGNEHMFVGDVRDFDSKEKQDVFYLHASPVCKNFSPASHSGGETTLDITTAEATARVLEEQMPQVFTVENVKRYIGSEAYNIIIKKLNELGYTWDVAVYKASDYGNATKRERMIIRAVKDGELPEKPQKVSNITSWGEATKDLWETDLIPSTLVRSKIEAIKNTPQLRGVKLTKLDKPLLIYDTTKAKTVSFAWADELAPTLTTKCGDARIIMPDGRVYAPTPKFMGRIQGLPDDYKYPKAVTNAFKIIGNGIPTQLTKAVMGGVLDSAYEQTHDGQVLYSDRSPDSVSTRSILANALETTVQNDIERSKLEQYKKKIDLIESEYEKLTKLKAEIKKLSFAKGTRDTKAIKSLQFEANETANKINTYDRQLLNLESTTALKNVLQREKKMAYEKAKKEGKAALAKQREREAKTIRTLMDKNTESRKKGIESRNKTEMRGKIKKVVNELNTLLLKPNAKKHIKEELRKEVANALSAINMDTVGADERVAMYNALIAKESNPDVIAELTKTRDRIQFQGDKLKDKFVNLQSAYEKIKNTDDIELNLAYQEVIHNSIKAVSEKVGDTSIRNMTFEQLEMVYDLLKMIRHTIRDANKSFTTKKGETVMQMAEAVNDQVRTVGGQPYKRNAIVAALQRGAWTLLKPLVAFRTIGSITFTNLYKELRNGEDTFYGDVKEAQAFIEEQYKKHGYKSWDMKKTKTFTAKSGKTFNLTLEQMMTLYAYSRREQAHKHIIEGGIVFEDAMVIEKNKAGIPIKYEVTTKDAFNLSEETFAEIANSLTAEQKAFVDAMQHYLSVTMGAKGNEVSMELLGVKLFKEEFYLPIKSSQYYMNFKAEEAGEVKLKSPAFSKETVQHANNPIVLHNFTDLWAEHINDMSMYHAFVLPLEDFTRVYNYKTKTDDKVETMDTKATLETAFPGVTKYISKFLKDMNGGVRAETVGWAEKLTSLAKKGSVLGSASVAIQQPSAVMRAMAMINPKYFVTTAHKSINLAKHKQDWEELKKYAPVAGIKEMGRFDVGMGQGTVDWIQSNKTLMEKGEDILSVAPAFMDEVTWVSIWNAVKNETAHTRKDLSPDSDEFLKVAGERFTDVISLTQVYDSVFSRSDLMRNKSWIAKALTAFMAEPTTTFNMLWDAWVQAKRTGSVKGYVKATTTTGGAIVASYVLNAVLKSIVMAMRDDDEDESYAEKYLENFLGELKDSLNPLSLVPFVKDIVSIFKGYDVERMDMALFSDLKKAIDAFDSDNKTLYDKWSGLIGAISAFFGIPVKNVERDVRASINTFFGDKVDTTKAGLLNAITEGWTGEDKTKVQNLYDAILNGDQKHIDRAKSQYKDDKAIESATRQGLRENDSRIHEAAQARYDGDIEEYKRIAKEIIAEGYFSQDTVVAAINAEMNAIKKGETTEDEQIVDTTEKVNSIYKASDVNSAFESGDTEMALEVIDDLINTKIANGMTEKEAKASIRSTMTTYWKPLYKEAYKSGNTSEKERIERILKASQLYGTASEVIKTCREWRTERD